MGSTKYEVEKFTGQNDFGLWKLKMKALLVQQDLLEACEEDRSSLRKIRKQCWRKLKVQLECNLLLGNIGVLLGNCVCIVFVFDSLIVKVVRDLRKTRCRS